MQRARGEAEQPGPPQCWSLLATRSMLWNDRMSRTTTFLSVLSAAVVALALVANATGFGPTTRTVALVLLPVVLLIGLATFVRLVEIAPTGCTRGSIF